MKFRKILVSIEVLAIAGFALYFLSAPKISEKMVEVNYPVNITMDQLRTPEKIAGWLKPFAGNKNTRFQKTDSATFISLNDYKAFVASSSYYKTEIVAGEGKNEKTYLLLVVPDSTSFFKSKVKLAYERSLFEIWIKNNDFDKYMDESLENFKSYMQSSKQLYGYDIKEIKVVDTLFLYRKRKVKNTDISVATNDMYTELIDFANKRKADYRGVRLYHAERSGGDSITVSAAIGINKKIGETGSNDIYIKQMPYQHNLLAVNYTGTLSSVQHVYAALDRYREDHEKTSMAIPFAKIISEGKSFNDTQQVHMLVCMPVY